jgi:2-dehydropantoate 2-reductase
MDEFRNVPETRRLLSAIIAEVAAVAAAQGVQLDEDIVEKTLAFIDAAAPGVKPSMQRDVESGRTSELEALVGVIVRMGRENGVPTPATDVAYALLKPGDMKAQ